MTMVIPGPGPENRDSLSTLLEGYFHGLGEVCHTLFGAEGEAAIGTSFPSARGAAASGTGKGRGSS